MEQTFFLNKIGHCYSCSCFLTPEADSPFALYLTSYHNKSSFTYLNTDKPVPLTNLFIFELRS